MKHRRTVLIPLQIAALCCLADSFSTTMPPSSSAAFLHARPSMSSSPRQRFPKLRATAGASAVATPVIAAPNGSEEEERDGRADDERPAVQLVFPGGGIFFYWQAGAVCHLRESGYDLSGMAMSGASAGALTATLTATGVDFCKATELALDLAQEAGVWDRPLGLQGVWGGLIERWLEELLPEDAADIANAAGLSLLVTPVPSFGKTRADRFVDRSDLIRACMASIHIPWFLDGKLTTTYRNDEHIDGSFLSKATDYVSRPQPKSLVRLDWTEDPALADREWGDFVKALSKDGIWDLLEKGKCYARFMEERGDFASLPRLCN